MTRFNFVEVTSYARRFLRPAVAASRLPRPATGSRSRMLDNSAEIKVDVSGTLRANNVDALVAAAVAGQGIVYQPTFILADDLRRGTLLPITLDQPTGEFGGIYGVYLPQRNPPAKVRVFIDFMIEQLAPVPPWDRA